MYIRETDVDGLTERLTDQQTDRQMLTDRQACSLDYVLHGDSYVSSF